MQKKAKNVWFVYNLKTYIKLTMPYLSKLGWKVIIAQFKELKKEKKERSIFSCLRDLLAIYTSVLLFSRISGVGGT